MVRPGRSKGSEAAAEFDPRLHRLPIWVCKVGGSLSGGEGGCWLVGGFQQVGNGMWILGG